MAPVMNRRRWLKTSTMITGGISLLSGTIGSLIPAAASASPLEILDEGGFGEKVATRLKARLFANENPFGPSEKAKAAIMEAINSSYQYPVRDMDLHSDHMIGSDLVDKIVAYEGIQKEMLMVTPGSSPVLQAAAIYFTKDGGSIITGDPSYDDLTEQAENFKAKVVRVPLTSEYKLDLDAMEKAIDSTTKLVYVCNPNNPTATVLETAKLKDFCERVSKKVTVLVDEAYIDYLPNPQETTLIGNVKKGNNIIVARTFSKLYGFAGLRVGYMIAQPEMIRTIMPYCVNMFGISYPSICAAVAGYRDEVFLQDALKKTNASKEFLYKTLKSEGYDYVPSSTNFVLFPIKMDGKRFSDEMWKRGIALRYWKIKDNNYCRLSIGRMDEMEAFAAAFKELS